MSTEALKKWREEHPGGVKAGPPRNPAQKWRDKDTRATAINAKCWDCMGGSVDHSAGVRNNIATCTSGPGATVPCPLYEWRPYK